MFIVYAGFYRNSFRLMIEGGKGLDSNSVYSWLEWKVTFRGEDDCEEANNFVECMMNYLPDSEQYTLSELKSAFFKAGEFYK